MTFKDFKYGSCYKIVGDLSKAPLKRPPNDIPVGEVVRFEGSKYGRYDGYTVIEFSVVDRGNIGRGIELWDTEIEPDWSEYFEELPERAVRAPQFREGSPRKFSFFREGVCYRVIKELWHMPLIWIPSGSVNEGENLTYSHSTYSRSDGLTTLVFVLPGQKEKEIGIFISGDDIEPKWGEFFQEVDAN